MLRPAASPPSVVSSSPNLELFLCPALETRFLSNHSQILTFTAALNCVVSKKLNLCAVFNRMLVESNLFSLLWQKKKMFYWGISTKESTLLLLRINNMNVIHQVAPNIRLQFK